MKYVTLIFMFLMLLTAHTTMYAQQKGKATYYSKRATGSRTSSGEILHHDSMTCAHRTYPFGAMLKVTNPANGKSVVVKVTDRGPFSRGKIIDLSWGAAKEIGMLSQGVATVIVEQIGTSKGIPFKDEEPINLPEIDFEVANAGYSFIDNWNNKNEQTEHQEIKHKSLKRHIAERQQTKKATPKKNNNNTQKVNNKTEDNKTNKWEGVFEKLKNWGDDLF